MSKNIIPNKVEENAVVVSGYSWKFYAGFVLVVMNIPLGWLGMWIFFFSKEDFLLSFLGAIVYLLSWGVLALGLWWVGKEYAAKIRRYMDYKFYHESLKKGTAKAYLVTKERTKRLRENAKFKTREFRERAINRTNQVREKVRAQLNKVKTRSPFKKKGKKN